MVNVKRSMFRDGWSKFRYEWSKFRGLEMDDQCSEVNGQSLGLGFIFCC